MKSGFLFGDTARSYDFIRDTSLHGLFQFTVVLGLLAIKTFADIEYLCFLLGFPLPSPLGLDSHKNWVKVK